MELNLTPDDLRKAASALADLSDRDRNHEKRAQATRLLFGHVERGLMPAPRSMQDFETKVASLMDKDLKVVEEALKLASGGGLGTIEEGPQISSGESEAQRQFQHALLEG
jgi:hypothetical protein